MSTNIETQCDPSFLCGSKLNMMPIFVLPFLSFRDYRVSEVSSIFETFHNHFLFHSDPVDNSPHCV